jgi:hypothetical protein
MRALTRGELFAAMCMGLKAGKLFTFTIFPLPVLLSAKIDHKILIVSRAVSRGKQNKSVSIVKVIHGQVTSRQLPTILIIENCHSSSSTTSFCF